MDNVMKTGSEKILEIHLNKYFQTGAIHNQCLDAMKEYARQKCKEQRELCQKHYLDTAAYEDIKSAPEPEFD